MGRRGHQHDLGARVMAAQRGQRVQRLDDVAEGAVLDDEDAVGRHGARAVQRVTAPVKPAARH